MPRLLVVAPNWLGDALLATALLQALKRQRPDAAVDVLCVPRVADLLRGQPLCDDIIVFDERGADRGWPARWRLSRRLRQASYEAALLLRPSASRAWLLWLAGIPRRIGHMAGRKSWWLTDRVAAPTATTHRARGYLELLRPLGLGVSSEVTTSYIVDAADRAWAVQWLAEQGITRDRPLVLVHPAGNWAHKRWPAESFARLIDRLRTRAGAQVIITGAPEDVAVAAAVREHLQTSVIMAAGATTLRQLAALIAQADLLVVNDSGPLHLAAALRRPYLALFGPTSPAVTGPYHAPTGRMLHHTDCCPHIPCYDDHHPSHPGMASLTVDEVAAAALELLPSRRAVAGTAS